MKIVLFIIYVANSDHLTASIHKCIFTILYFNKIHAKYSIEFSSGQTQEAMEFSPNHAIVWAVYGISHYPVGIEPMFVSPRNFENEGINASMLIRGHLCIDFSSKNNKFSFQTNIFAFKINNF